MKHKVQEGVRDTPATTAVFNYQPDSGENVVGNAYSCSSCNQQPGNPKPGLGDIFVLEANDSSAQKLADFREADDCAGTSIWSRMHHPADDLPKPNKGPRGVL